MGRRRSKSPKGGRRDRSRDRDSYSGRHDDENRSSSRSAAKGIEAVKNRMKSQLDEAKRELTEASTSNADARSSDYSVSASDSARLTREIERIDTETGGFRPSEYKSTSGGAGGRMRKDGTGYSELEKKQRAHDRAIFEPSARATTMATETSEQPAERTVELAHPLLSEDPEIRNRRWLNLLQQQRRELLC